MGHRRRYRSEPARRRVPARCLGEGCRHSALPGRAAGVDGTFEGGEKSLGLAEEGVGLGHPHESVPQDVLDTIAAYEQAIIDGTITVPADEEELASFEPVALDAIATPTA